MAMDEAERRSMYGLVKDGSTDALAVKSGYGSHSELQQSNPPGERLLLVG